MPAATDLGTRFLRSAETGLMPLRLLDGVNEIHLGHLTRFDRSSNGPVAGVSQG
jgi:hypothetical protein